MTINGYCKKINEIVTNYSKGVGLGDKILRLRSIDTYLSDLIAFLKKIKEYYSFIDCMTVKESIKEIYDSSLKELTDVKDQEQKAIRSFNDNLGSKNRQLTNELNRWWNDRKEKIKGQYSVELLNIILQITSDEKEMKKINDFIGEYDKYKKLVNNTPQQKIIYDELMKKDNELLKYYNAIGFSEYPEEVRKVLDKIAKKENVTMVDFTPKVIEWIKNNNLSEKFSITVQG